MKHLAALLLAASLTGVASCPATAGVVRHDCQELSACVSGGGVLPCLAFGEDWLANNGQNVVRFLWALKPLLAERAAWLPDVMGWVKPDYAGVNVSLPKFSLTVGGSPRSTVNMALGLVCLRWEE